jgi:outer membrane protein assembly factor BamD (BamD/ComL family)
MLAGPARLLLAGALLAGGGCAWDGFSWRQLNPFEPAVVDPDTETFVLRGGALVSERAAATVNDKVATTMACAREHFRREEYDKAESFFGRIAENEKNGAAAVQEAIYFQAECLRLQGYYPKAADLYSSLLSKFPNSGYREQCVQHMFDIANYWLDDTRQQMREDRERREGKRWVVWPRFLSTEKSKPFLDREGRAVEKLEQVRLHDINGPLADEALFMCGVVKMYNENYREADHYFSQIPLRHPESKRAAQATKLAIFCKHMSTGGSDYDGRKAAEARKLIQTAFNSYPELAHSPETRDWLENQQKSIDLQQAEKDYKMGEFYRRTGHPASAYFYYELVQRRYPSTKFAQLARERWDELRGEVEKEQANEGGFLGRLFGHKNYVLPGAKPQPQGAAPAQGAPAGPARPSTLPAPTPTPTQEPAPLGTLPDPTPLPPNPATLPTPTR